MTSKQLACAVLAAAGLAAGASAQSLDLYLVQNQDISALSGSSASPTWIGTNPSCVAFDGTNLYVGGYNASAGSQDVQIVRIDNILLAAPTFLEITETRRSVPTSVGFTGMDWDAAGGLLATLDVPGNEGQVQLLRFDSSGVLTSRQQSPLSAPTSGTAGPAWDHGPDGLGYDYLPFDPQVSLTPGDGTIDGPVPCVATFGETYLLGLFEGLSAENSDYVLNAGLGSAYFPDFVTGPELIVGSTGSMWRNVDIDPYNGTVAGRSNNQLIITTRNADNSGNSVAFADRITPPGGEAALVQGQNSAIMHGLSDATLGDLVAWNDRAVESAGQAFDAAVRFTKLSDKSSVTAAWHNADGTPLTFGAGGDIADGNGYYDFDWDEPDQLLVVSDFQNRRVYFFSPAPQVQPCPCEVDGDAAQVNVFDLLAYLSDWFAQNGMSGPDLSADINGSGNVDVFDLLDFLSCWFSASAGNPCP